MKIIIKNILVSLLLISSTSLIANNYYYNSVKDLKIKKGINSEVDIDPYNIVENYTMNPQDPSFSISGNCVSSIGTETTLNLYYGAATCSSFINKNFSFNPNQIIDISFNIQRLEYGSNYVIVFEILDVFQYIYHRDQADWFQYGNSAIYRYPLSNVTTLNNNNFRILYENNNLKLYVNEQLTYDVPNYIFPTLSNVVLNPRVNNSYVRISDLKIIIKE